APEAARRVVGEIGQVADELDQDHLRDVLSIRLLKLPAQTPGMDLRTIAVDEGRPGGLIARVIPQSHEDADPRALTGRLGHGPTSPGRNLAPSRRQQVFLVRTNTL